MLTFINMGLVVQLPIFKNSYFMCFKLKEFKEISFEVQDTLCVGFSV